MSRRRKKNSKKNCVGVRRDDVIYMISPERRNMLHFSRPCVCGSFTHISTRSSYCIFNTKYMDA